jgi:hypothetical protein
MTIGGGKNNKLTGDYGFIGGGNGNQVLGDSTHASIVGGKSNIINGLSDYSVILGGENNQIWGAHSIAMGKNAQIGASGTLHPGVFMFSDSTVDESAFKSYSSDQFLVHATNGILFGLSDFNHKEALSVSSSKTYPPSGQTVKDHTIRTAGDIVAADAQGNLGYLVGDGSFITNVSSVWVGDDANGSVYLDGPIRVGIGANNNSHPATSMLYVKSSGTYPANARFESHSEGINSEGINSAGIMDVGVNGADGVIETSGQLLFKQSGTDTFKITNNKLISSVNVGINVLDPEHALDVAGTARITGVLESGGLTTSGTITANAFVGYGAGITGIQVSNMVPSSGDQSGEKHMVMSDDGFVAIGQVALDHAIASSNTVDALLHVGDASSTQLKLEKKGDAHSRFTTMTSGTQFDLTFHNYNSDNDKIFSINSTKDAILTSLVMVSAKGHVGIGMDPSGTEMLSVAGWVSANAFIGNGSQLKGVQLNSDQSNQVTFKATITFEDTLKLTPRQKGDAPSCADAGVGTIYAIYSGSTSSLAVAICACINDDDDDDDARQNLIDNANDGACE